MSDIIQCFLEIITHICQFHNSILELSHPCSLETSSSSTTTTGRMQRTQPILFRLEPIQHLDDRGHIYICLGLACLIMWRQSKGGAGMNRLGMCIKQRQHCGRRTRSGLTGMMYRKLLLIILGGCRTGIDLKKHRKCILRNTLLTCQVQWQATIVILALCCLGP